MDKSIFWRLHYADGSFIDEPRDAHGPGAILDTKPGPIAIQVTAPPAIPGYPLQLGFFAKLVDLETGRLVAPVFLRRVRVDVVGGKTKVIATIFGRGWRKLDGDVTGQLWIIPSESTVRHCEPCTDLNDHDLREISRCIDLAPKARSLTLKGRN